MLYLVSVNWKLIPSGRLVMAKKKAISSNNKRKRGRPSKAELQEKIEKNDLFIEKYLFGG